MNRRGFLRSGAVLGMAGALIGAGSGSAQATDNGLGMPSMPPASGGASWPELPRPDAVTLTTVAILPEMQAVRSPGYAFSGEDRTPSVDPAQMYVLKVTIDGRDYGLMASNYEEPPGG